MLSSEVRTERRPSLLRRIYRNRLAYLFLLPASFLIAIFIAYPLVDSLVISFFDWDGLTEREFTGFRNFEEILFGDPRFWLAMRNNAIFSGLTVVGTIGIGFSLALVIERRVFGWALFKVIYFLPVMMSSTVIGILWHRLYDSHFGPINGILRAMGLEQLAFEWLGDPNVVIYAVVIVSIWQFAGFPMIIFLAAMENISPEIHDAADIDGVGPWTRVRYVIFPLVRRVFVVLTMLQLIFSFLVFDLIWVMTEGGPGLASSVLTTYLYREAFRFHSFGTASAVAVAMFVVIMTFSLVYLRVVRPDRIEY